ncbi:unnamed protein product [Clonostachys chloroleuca]|uniref:NAD-dependent epimerase/dehydratase domain-containing protein n=1 Tax=Clonostachys chloroleuca TaxID=1926264 RepID=A0AA35Q526_9HYPO|nr:unnamed protein product [Clonostachys chloroleuca]
MHKRVLLTGATGYVGGSVLTSLLASPRLEPISISVLARDLKRLAALEGIVSLVTFRDLDDTDSLESIASKFDIVYPLRQWSPRGLSTSVHPWAGPKKKVTGWRTILHPRTSSLGDYGITKRYVETRAFSDKQDDIFEYEERRENIAAYPQRTADISVIQAGEETGIKKYIMMPPCIIGRGTGPYRQQSHQVPMLVRNAIRQGQSEFVGDGSYTIGHVDIQDLANVFELLLSRLLAGESLPYGRRGIYFSNTGSHTWLEVAQAIGVVGHELGLSKVAEPKPVELSELARREFNNDRHTTELVLAAK